MTWSQVAMTFALGLATGLLMRRGLERVPEQISCRVCGCTDDHACFGGCYWVESDLCSTCANVKRVVREGMFR